MILTNDAIEITIPERPDSDGDLFVRPIGYINNLVSCETLEQLRKNFESSWPYEVFNKENLSAALKFANTILMEIGETAPGTRYAEAAIQLSWLIVEDDPITTAERLAAIRNDKKSKQIQAAELVMRASSDPDQDLRMLNIRQ
jgi:hypothetical protein